MSTKQEEDDEEDEDEHSEMIGSKRGGWKNSEWSFGRPENVELDPNVDKKEEKRFVI